MLSTKFFFVICFLLLSRISARFDCPEKNQDIPGCQCNVLDKNDFRLYCLTTRKGKHSSTSTSHDLAIKPGEYVGIRCGVNFKWKRFLNGAQLQIDFLETITLSECRPINISDYNIIKKRLGLNDSVESIKYDALIGELKPENLEIFDGLKRLELAENNLVKVDKDLLRGEYETSLNIKES